LLQAAHHAILHFRQAACIIGNRRAYLYIEDKFLKTVIYKFGFYWMPMLACMLAIFLVSNTNANSLGQVKEGAGILPPFISNILTSHYFVHPVEFGVLAASTYHLFRYYKPLSTRLVVSATLAWTISYAVLDEIHQSFVEGRSSAISDVGLDASGILIALILILLFGRRWRALIGSIKL
jgi:VanZ family protein